MPLIRTDSIKTILPWSLGIFLVGVALVLRLSLMEREVWLDEALASMDILGARDFFSLRKSIDYQLQPILDYALKKWIYYPFFGSHERGIRLPSLIYSLMTVAMVVHLSYRGLARTIQDRWIVISGTLLLGFWCAVHSNEILYATDAKHYSFVSLVSALWFWLFFFEPKQKLVGIFELVSLILLNSHFFSIPLVISAYFFFAGTALRFGDRRRALSELGVLTTLLAVSVTLNYPAFHAMFFHPIAQPLPLIQGDRSLLDRGYAGLQIYFDFFRYLEIPWVFACLAVATAWAWFASKDVNRRGFLSKQLLLFALVFPAFFFLLRVKSSYPFNPRYYTPFFGSGWVIGFLAIECFGKLVDRRTQYLGALFTVFLAIFCLARGLSTLGDVRWPEKNFTKLHEFFSELKSEKAPVFFVGNPCHGLRIADYQWNRTNQTRPASDAPVFAPWTFPKEACSTFELAGVLSGKLFQRFLEETQGEGRVVLIDIHRPCAVPDRSLRSHRFEGIEIQVQGISVMDLSGGTCVRIFKGIRTPKQLEQVVLLDGFQKF